MPDKIDNPAHWQDLQAGALFFQARDAALAVLDALEAHIASLAGGARHALRGATPVGVVTPLANLRQVAAEYLRLDQTRTEDPLRREHVDAMAEAAVFCSDCVTHSDNDALRELVERDERVLHLKGDDVVPGPAFDGARGRRTREAEVDARPAASQGAVQWPEGLSYRVRNLFLLNADLHGKLDDWLDDAAANGEDL